MKLPQAFYNQPTDRVAQHLLGAVLVRHWHGHTIKGIICETEAYIGPHDLASHASRGRTPRTETMFGPSGFWYIYLIYGMYHCLNIVTEKNGYPAAVLIRAVVPIAGIPKNVKTDGPGKLCKAFSISRSLNATPGYGHNAEIWVEKRKLDITRSKIKKTPRIGVNYAGAYKDKLWRYVVAPNVIQGALRQGNR